MEEKTGLPILSFESQARWEEWLDEHHAAQRGIWMKIAKKASETPSITYPEAVESALCYGWIDGQKAALDEHAWLQKFSPRGPKSQWSKVNREKAEALIGAGRMKPSGLRQVELAKADGRWELAYEPQSRITAPEDFQRELNLNPPAQEFFNSLNSANRYAILHRIQIASSQRLAPDVFASLSRCW